MEGLSIAWAPWALTKWQGMGRGRGSVCETRWPWSGSRRFLCAKWVMWQDVAGSVRETGDRAGHGFRA